VAIGRRLCRAVSGLCVGELGMCSTRISVAFPGGAWIATHRCISFDGLLTSYEHGRNGSTVRVDWEDCAAVVFVGDVWAGEL
jgi:hypothetical protein